MNSLTVTIKPSQKRKKVSVELDAARFERLAANLGMFRKEFLESLAQAERELSQGKTHRLESLHNLRGR